MRNGKAPHGGDFFFPRVESFAELDELRQVHLPQLVHSRQELGDEASTLLAGAMFFEQKVAKELFESVDDREGGKLFQIGVDFSFLLEAEMAMMAANE